MDPVTEQGRVEFAGEQRVLGWAVACRSKIEGAPSGDGYLVRRMGNSVLLAVADGAGSGTEAAEVTKTCLRTLSETNTASLDTLFAQVHHAVQGTRGLALGVTLVDPANWQISWCAVGDIEGVLFHRPASAMRQSQVMIQKGGTLGYTLPKLIIQCQQIGAGAVIIMTSDGIRHASRDDVVPGNSAGEIANNVLAARGRDNDDAIVLAATLDGPS